MSPLQVGNNIYYYYYYYLSLGIIAKVGTGMQSINLINLFLVNKDYH